MTKIHTTEASTAASSVGYEAPVLIDLGKLQELTFGCNKTDGYADGYYYHGDSIVCGSA